MGGGSALEPASEEAANVMLELRPSDAAFDKSALLPFGGSPGKRDSAFTVWLGKMDHLCRSGPSLQAATASP